MLNYFYRSAFFATNKYQIVKGKYLVPLPPKRPLSSYMIFSNEARKGFDTKSVTQASKQIAEKWKNLSAGERKSFEDQAEKLNQEYRTQKTTYQNKYVHPFESATQRVLIMKDFYANNKVQFGKAALALKEHIQKMPSQVKANFEKKAAEVELQREKVRKMYTIPQPPYRSFDSYLRSQRKADSSIPLKSQMSPKDVEKYRRKYEAEIQNYDKELKVFASSFGIKKSDLANLITKSKKKEDQDADTQNEMTETAKKLIDKSGAQLKKNKQKMVEETKRIKALYERKAQAQIRSLQKSLGKKNSASQKLLKKGEALIAKVKRAKSESKIEKSNSEMSSKGN